jgi:hypothetical protein
MKPKKLVFSSRLDKKKIPTKAQRLKKMRQLFYLGIAWTASAQDIGLTKSLDINGN